MKTVRKAQDRGHANFGWLNSHHSFSFGRYHDPNHMGFRALRVINDDHVTAGAGFGEHPHDNMEIISYVVDGELEHRDSMGTGSVIKPGDVQLMSAGTGVTHSEFNGSKDRPVHFLQIWLPPSKQGLTPSYQQQHFDHVTRSNKLALLVSPNGRDESLTIHRDVRIFGGLLEAQARAHIELAEGRYAWVQVVRGSIKVDDVTLAQGDGLAITQEDLLTFEGINSSEFLVFDLD